MGTSRRDVVKSCLGFMSASVMARIRPLVSSISGLTALGCRSGIYSDQTGTHRRRADIDPNFEPGYVALHRSGALKERAELMWQMMSECALCPRECGANRLKGNRGVCQSSSVLETSGFSPHFGEERSLVGKGGSGTVFMTNCGLRCVFCINWQVSQGGAGERTSLNEFARMMLRLQARGCHNINIVTPTHYSPHMVKALDMAAARGLRLPLVYNTCGWEKPDILKLLEGIVDIYLPDFKYADSDMAETYSRGADSYPQVTQAAILEMYRQVGSAKPAKDGLMYGGLMIRHLVMPNDVGGTKRILDWIATHLPNDTYINLMSQYRPVFEADSYPKIARRITRQEYHDAVTHAQSLGLTNLDIQGYRSW